MASQICYSPGLCKPAYGGSEGSDKHFSFSIPARNECRKLHLFESAIDLLSHGTLELLSGKDWRQENCLSLAGIYMPKKIIEESTPPAALIQYLKDFPQIKENRFTLQTTAPAGRSWQQRLSRPFFPPHLPFPMSLRSMERIITTI
jgi:hypothetical protein